MNLARFAGSQSSKKHSPSVLSIQNTERRHTCIYESFKTSTSSQCSCWFQSILQVCPRKVSGDTWSHTIWTSSLSELASIKHLWFRFYLFSSIQTLSISGLIRVISLSHVPTKRISGGHHRMGEECKSLLQCISWRIFPKEMYTHRILVPQSIGFSDNYRFGEILYQEWFVEVCEQWVTCWTWCYQYSTTYPRPA